MVSCDEALLIFRKWASEGTPLLFRGTSSSYTPSMLGMLESAESGVIRFRVLLTGYIDIHLSPAITFEYFDPATGRDMQCDVMAMLDQSEPVATGAGIVAFKSAAETFMLLEILLG